MRFFRNKKPPTTLSASVLLRSTPCSLALFAEGGGRWIVADQGAMLAGAVDAVSCPLLAAAGTIAAAHRQLTFNMLALECVGLLYDLCACRCVV